MGDDEDDTETLKILFLEFDCENFFCNFKCSFVYNSVSYKTHKRHWKYPSCLIFTHFASLLPWRWPMAKGFIHFLQTFHVRFYISVCFLYSSNDTYSEKMLFVIVNSLCARYISYSIHQTLHT